jgi:hypothetical protein
MRAREMAPSEVRSASLRWGLRLGAGLAIACATGLITLGVDGVMSPVLTATLIAVVTAVAVCTGLVLGLLAQWRIAIARRSDARREDAA